MPDNEIMTCRIFETEMWLYIDRSLSDDKMEFWRSHLRSCNTCSELLTQSEEIISYAAENLITKMDESLFDDMVVKAIQSKKPGIIKPELLNKKEKIFSIAKVVFASALVIIAVLVSLISDKPNSVKSIGKEIFEWEGSSLVTEIEDISNTINMLHQNDWNKQVQRLDQEIEQIEKNSNELSFY